jgi:hypothetical protein
VEGSAADIWIVGVTALLFYSDVDVIEHMPAVRTAEFH